MPTFEPSSLARRVILVMPGEVTRVVDEAEAALVMAGRGLHQHRGRIVRVQERRASFFVPTGRCVVEPGAHALREDLAAAAAFLAMGRNGPALVTCDPPFWIVGTLRARVKSGRSQLPHLPPGLASTMPTRRWA